MLLLIRNFNCLPKGNKRGIFGNLVSAQHCTFLNSYKTYRYYCNILVWLILIPLSKIWQCVRLLRILVTNRFQCSSLFSILFYLQSTEINTFLSYFTNPDLLQSLAQTYVYHQSTHFENLHLPPVNSLSSFPLLFHNLFSLGKCIEIFFYDFPSRLNN